MRYFLVRAALLLSLALCLSAGPVQFITLQPVIVTDPSNAATQADINNEISFAQTIFAQIGLQINVFPTILRPASDNPALSISMGTDEASVTTFLTDASWQPFPVLTAWWVRDINGVGSGIRGESFRVTINGGSRYGIGLANTEANDTLAHEIGHVLTDFSALWQPAPSDGAHSSDPTNLLAYGAIRNIPAFLSDVYIGSQFDQIQPVQSSAMLNDAFSNAPSPEPSVIVLIGSGIAAVAFIRRRAA